MDNQIKITKKLAKNCYKILTKNHCLTLTNKIKSIGFQVKYFDQQQSPHLITFAKWNNTLNCPVIAINIYPIETSKRLLEGLFIALMLKSSVRKDKGDKKFNYRLYKNSSTKMNTLAKIFANTCLKLDDIRR